MQNNEQRAGGAQKEIEQNVPGKYKKFLFSDGEKMNSFQVNETNELLSISKVLEMKPSNQTQ